MVGLGGASWLFNSIQFSAWLAFGELQAKGARDRLFTSLLGKEIEWYDRRKNGIHALLPRLQAQIRDLQLATSQPLGSAFELISVSILSLIQALVFSWDLTLITLATVPFIMAAVFWLGRKIQPNIAKQQDKLSEAEKFSSSAFAAIDTVKCFNGQETEFQKYTESIRGAARWYARVANANAMQMALVVLLSVSMFVQGFYYGGVLVGDGKRNTGQVVTTFLSAIDAFQALQAILPQTLVFERGRNAGFTLRTTMTNGQWETATDSSQGRLVPTSCHGHIIINSLSFAYPTRPEHLVLQNVTLHIPAREMSFLIGKSGSGKSTLGQLLLRFYSPDQGRIFIDDTELRNLELLWLRSNVTLVEQQTVLFNDTIWQNIALGRNKKDALSYDKIVSAAEFALLHDMVLGMHNGLDAFISSNGGSLSGGQRQRMALARARLRDTPILILDEATSALDHVSRNLIMDAIRRWRQGRTTIVITHDVSQILPDDHVNVLENGQLVQAGKRKHLEEVKNATFRSFLGSDLKMDIETYRSFDEKSLEALIAEPWLESHMDISPHKSLDIQPLETSRYLGGKDEARLLPTDFQKSAAVKGFRSLSGRTSPIPPFASPWLPPTPFTAALTANLNGAVTYGAGREELLSGTSPKLFEQLTSTSGSSAIESRAIRSIIFHPTGHKNETELNSPNRTDHLEQSKFPDKSNSDYVESYPAKSLWKIFGTMWPNMTKSTKVLLGLGFWGATIHALSSPVFSHVLSRLLETYTDPSQDRHKALLCAMAILAIAVNDAVHVYLFKFFLEYAGQCWADRVRGEAFKRILDQSKTFFEQDENKVSSLTERLGRNADEMRNLLGRFAGLAYTAIVMCFMSTLWAAIVQWKLTLIALTAAPYLFLVTKAFARISEKWETLSNDASEAVGAIFTETFTTIKTVRAFVLEDHFLQECLKSTNHALRMGIRRSLYVGFFYGLSNSSSIFCTAILYYTGTRFIHSGTPVSDVIQVVVILMFMLTNVTTIITFLPQIGASKDTASRLLRLAQLSKETHETLGNVKIATVGDICFENLQFAYPSRPEQAVLRNFSLCIPSGTSTAIVGSSGSGKSTIANLLLGLYITTSFPCGGSGELRLAGNDIRRICTPLLRSLIVSIPQTPTLFAATVAENISYGLPAISPHNNLESISTAAKQAGIHDFITSLPLGYNTVIGDGGLGLSGGQTQRIVIARALVRKPAVLILDEATSALDPESARLVRQSIKDLIAARRGAMTLIFITHHRDMMEMADRIVVLDQGSVAEQGSFLELMARKGVLSRLLSGGNMDG